jgi:hypothetical protein
MSPSCLPFCSLSPFCSHIPFCYPRCRISHPPPGRPPATQLDRSEPRRKSVGIAGACGSRRPQVPTVVRIGPVPGRCRPAEQIGRDGRHPQGGPGNLAASPFRLPRSGSASPFRLPGCVSVPAPLREKTSPSGESGSLAVSCVSGCFQQLLEVSREHRPGCSVRLFQRGRDVRVIGQEDRQGR